MNQNKSVFCSPSRSTKSNYKCYKIQIYRTRRCPDRLSSSVSSNLSRLRWWLHSLPAQGAPPRMFQDPDSARATHTAVATRQTDVGFLGHAHHTSRFFSICHQARGSIMKRCSSQLAVQSRRSLLDRLHTWFQQQVEIGRIIRCQRGRVRNGREEILTWPSGEKPRAYLRACSKKKRGGGGVFWIRWNSYTRCVHIMVLGTICGPTACCKIYSFFSAFQRFSKVAKHACNKNGNHICTPQWIELIQFQ